MLLYWNAGQVRHLRHVAVLEYWSGKTLEMFHKGFYYISYSMFCVFYQDFISPGPVPDHWDNLWHLFIRISPEAIRSNWAIYKL